MVSLSSNIMQKVNEPNVKCRYCGDARPTRDMTTIPKNRRQLCVWIEILGPEFAKNIKNFNYNYICINHIENGERRGHYRLPKNVHNIILIKSKPKVKKTPKYKSDKVCRYCGVSRSHSDMTSVPSVPKQLAKWIKILGPEFAENIKQFKTNSICLDHIENRDRRHSRLPKRMDNVQKLISDNDDDEEIDEESAQKKMEKNNDRRSERLAKQKRIDYTFGDDEEDENEEMEDDEEEYEEMESIGTLSEISGSETNEIEIQNHSTPTVLELETEEQDNDSVEMETPKYEEPEHNEVGVKQINQFNLADAILEKEDDSKWIEILGPELTENITNSEKNRICSNHFESQVEYPSGNLKRTVLVPDNIDIEDIPVVDPKPTKSEKENRVDKLEGPAHNGPHVSEVEVAEKVEIVNEEQNQEMTEKEHAYEKMESNGQISEMVGSHTVEMENENQSNYIVLRLGMMQEYEEVDMSNCDEMKPGNTSDPTVANMKVMNPNGQCAMPILAISENLISERSETGASSEEAKLEEMEDDRDVEIVAPKSEVSEQVREVVQVETEDQLSVTITNLESDIIQCRVCNGYFNKNSMTETPTNPKILQKWIGVLGSEFFGNIIQNSPPYFICLIHLRSIVDKVFEEE